MYSILALTSVTRFGNLPEELLHHIISFNEIEAVQIIQKNMAKMLKNKISSFKMLNVHIFREGLRNSRIKYSIFYNNRIISNEEVVKTLSMCNCCARHKIDRPKTLATWVDTPFHDRQGTNCSCNCRHLSRFICRDII